jgi:glycosyltransferase involved in cell wall biosynthesis
MPSVKDIRIAWIYPSIIYGAYWQPVMREFKNLCQNFIFYTGCVWPGFDPEDSDNSPFELVGETRYVQKTKTSSGYDRAFIYASPGVIFPLLAFRPQVTFASAFSIWTLLSLLFKPVGGWKIVIIYDGSSPNSDFQDSKFRSIMRRWMARGTDAFIANSEAAKNYLVNALGVAADRVFVRTYLVPDAVALQRRAQDTQFDLADVKRPVFLYVGQLIERKGVRLLLEACQLLKHRGFDQFTVLIVGDGNQRDELKAYVEDHGLKDYVEWAGWVEYGKLGPYFQQSDVFVFPTYEDVWGMVVLEAMVFGKPVLCSKGANSYEMVAPGENGYIFEPRNVEEVADGMQKFLENPDLISKMGQRSRELIAQYNPETAAHAFAEVAAHVLAKR